MAKGKSIICPGIGRRKGVALRYWRFSALILRTVSERQRRLKLDRVLMMGEEKENTRKEGEIGGEKGRSASRTVFLEKSDLQEEEVIVRGHKKVSLKTARRQQVGGKI